MGAFASVSLRPEEIVDLQEISGFTPREIRHLYSRFRRLDRGSKGTITRDDLMMIPELAMNPIAPRMMALFNRNWQDEINFKYFLTALSVFTAHTPLELKAKFMFAVLDVDADGFLSEDDLREFVGMMVGEFLTPDEITEVVTSTLRSYDADTDGKLSFAEFNAAIEGVPLQDRLTVHVGTRADTRIS